MRFEFLCEKCESSSISERRSNCNDDTGDEWKCEKNGFLFKLRYESRNKRQNVSEMNFIN